MALDKFQPYLFVSAGEQSNKLLTPTYSGGIASFQAQRAQQLTKLLVQIDPVQEGTGDPAPDNIRPITGWTGTTVTRAGKNLLPPAQSGSDPAGVTFTVNNDGSVTAVGTATATINRSTDFTVPVTGSYTLTGSPSGGGASTYQIWIREKSSGQTVGIEDTGNGATGTLTAGVVYQWQIRVASGYNINKTFYPMLRAASISDGTYAPYVGTTYPISWQTDAGTVYGGTLDVVSGVLTVNRFFKSFDGTENWARTGSIGANTNRYYIQWVNMGITGDVINLSDSLCSHLVFLSGNAGQFGTFNASTTNFAVKDGDGTQFADMAAFKAWLAAQNTAGTPLQLCVELATPQTYQLTGAEVRTIAGFNQIYSDAGPIIDIKF